MADGIPVRDGKLHLSCPACGKRNAVPVERLSDAPICGACKAALPLADQPLQLTDQNFEAVLRRSRLPLLVDFWAPGCGPCRMMEPAVRDLAKSVPGRGLVAKVNTHENPQVAMRFNIQAVPTVIVFRGGQAVQRQAGYMPQQALAGLLAA